MTRPAAKGWCPSAYAPMLSGDGLLVRIKPTFGQLTSVALIKLADLADEFGNGLLDLTSRANLQIRGVMEPDYPALLPALLQAGLAGPSRKAERLNVVLAPFTQHGTLGWRCATRLYAAAAALPELPAKFGFCIDCGGRRYLKHASGDLWIERAAGGGLLLRCAGWPEGMRTDEASLIRDLRKLIDWYLAHQPAGRLVRMHALLTDCAPPHWATGHRPQAAEMQLAVGRTGHHFIISAPYGRLRSNDLRQLAAVNTMVQFTTGRLIIVCALPAQDHQMGDHQMGDHQMGNHQLITAPHDRRLYIAACPGAPHCSSATIRTTELADSLSAAGVGSADQTVHVSGCTKGCAAPSARDICVVGVNESRFDILEKGRAWDPPSATGLSGSDVVHYVTQAELS